MNRADDALEPRLRVAPMNQSGRGCGHGQQDETLIRDEKAKHAPQATHDKPHAQNGGTVDAGLKSLDHCKLASSVALLDIPLVIV
jgi:hypothetical protein